MNKNEKAAMLAELKELIKEVRREAIKPPGGTYNSINIKAIQAQRVVAAVIRVLSAGLEYSMKRKDIEILFEDLKREAVAEVEREMEEQDEEAKHAR